MGKNNKSYSQLESQRFFKYMSFDIKICLEKNVYGNFELMNANNFTKDQPYLNF